LLDDSVADVDQWLADEVRDVFAAQETAAFVSGDGINKPRGFLDYPQQSEANHTWGNIGYVTTGTDGGFDPDAPIDALLDIIYAPEPRYRAQASFMMNRRTVSMVRKFKDADGHYIWQPAIEAGQGVRVLRDPFSAKPYVLFYTTKRVGGGVQDFNAIKLLKFSA